MKHTTAELLRHVPDLTFRKLDYWCNYGIFGIDNWRVGSGSKRAFDDIDIVIADALCRVSHALQPAPMELLSEIAERMREGERVLAIDLGHGVHLAVAAQAALLHLESMA